MCVWTKWTLCLNEGTCCKRSILNVLFWKISYIEELNCYRTLSPFPSNNFEQVQTLYSTVAGKKLGNFTKSAHSDVKSLLYFEDTQDNSHKYEGVHNTHMTAASTDLSLTCFSRCSALKLQCEWNYFNTIILFIYLLFVFYVMCW